MNATNHALSFSLTESQLGMYLEWSADHSSMQYNLCVDNRFNLGEIDAARLAEALRKVFAAYPTFRLRIAEQDGELVEFADDSFLPEVEERAATEAEIPKLRQAFKRPFNPHEESMTRAWVITTDEAVHLFTDFFHLISDGTAFRCFARALVAAYEGRELPRETMTFADYAVLEPTLFGEEAYRVAKESMAARFAGKTMTIPEGDTLAASDVGDDDLISAKVKLSRSAVEAFCREHGVHPNLFFMGAFARTLGIYGNTSEAVFFTINHGRRDPRLKDSLGCFVKTVPVLASFKADLSLSEYLNSLKVHGAGDYPFTHFCRDLGIKPGLGYVFQDGTVKLGMDFESASSKMETFSSVGVGKLPTLQVGGDAESYELSLTVLPGGYSQKWCAGFVGRVAEVARQFLAHPNSRLAEIPIVSEAEAKELMALSRGSNLDYDRSATFIDLFDRSVAAHGERTAVVDCDGRLTYGELSASSGALATKLAESGVKVGGFVGVMLPRRTSFMVTALAAQRCGAGYVPLDPEYPADRLAYMLENSEAPVLVTTHELFDQKGIAYGGKVIYFEDVPKTIAALPPSLATLDTPAYMIYTSGSTGKPKGVVIAERALVAFCAWVVELQKMTPENKVAVSASFSFDASVFDLFPVLTVGGEVHLFSEALRKDLAGMRDYAEANRLTSWIMSTQLGLAMLNAHPDLPLQSMLVGGEKILPFARTNVKVYNGYGPTEFTVASSYQLVDQDSAGEVPIGRPVPNSYSFICDRLGQFLPRGMVGELCLAGVQIADGYWKNPEKTASAFVKLPCYQDALAYRTGDYACYDAESRLLYRGRIDSQVKLRGFRIEIGEIEHAAAACEGVEAVAAEVRMLAGTQHLVLYYGGTADADAVKAKMCETLTGYMVPDYFVRMDKLPLTPVGKIDRKALPDPAMSNEPVVEPTNEMETKLLSAVRSVLRTDEIGVTHNFDRAGLTSLGAMALVAKLKKECGFNITLALLAKFPTVRELAGQLGTADGACATPAKRTKRPKRATYPMTENQRGVYSDWLRNPEATQYNVPAAFRFPSLDADLLAAAAAKVIEAHPVLKTRFIEKDGEIVQERRDSATLTIARETLKEEPNVEFFAARMRPFATSGEDLARFAVYAAPKASYLFLDVHHTIFDGFSMGVFLRDLLASLDGKVLADEVATMFDAGLAERDYLESELVAEDDEWFARYLDGCESTALEASERPPADIPPGTAARAVVNIASEKLNRRVAELGVSASDWFLTALMELLRRIGRSDDVQILFVSAGRTDADYANSVGMFVRTLPVRNVKDEPTFSGTVRRLHADVLALRDRDRASYARIAERNSLTPEIIFAYEGGLFDLPRGASLVSPPTTSAKFPLSVTVTPGKDSFELAFEYDASRYGASEMEKLLAALAHLCESAIQVDDLRAIPLVDESEAQALMALAYGGDIVYDEQQTFVDLLKAVTITRPFATALVDSEGAMTYGELDTASASLAGVLIAAGVKPNSFVAVKLGRTKDFIVAAIGVMRAGAAYVPIDPTYPADRIAYMVEDSRAQVVIDEAFMAEAKKSSSAAQVVNPLPTSPAYMIYTSGSTGRPKGVVIPHRALRHMLAWMTRDAEITYSSRVLEHASFSFDASVISIFPALSVGGEVHVLAEELRKDLSGMRDYILKNGITSSVMSTQIGMALLDAYPELPLHDLMFGGEKLMPIAKTEVKLFNGYGPTEFTVASSYQIVDQNETGDIPIGRAVAGTWSLVVDRYGQLLPQGLAGEIALAGPQIADGYWCNEEKTKKVFVNGRYHTGDLARYDERGLLMYLGRLDFQVKLRGFRIEIGEIEHVASLFPNIAAVAAEVREVGGVKHLVLYYAKNGGSIEVEALKHHLSASLAEYMVPDFYVELEKLPITPNGKIDRKKLPTPSATESAHEYVAPREGAEKTIAEAWGAILKLEKFGATDDFFALGGTSILGIKAVVALQKAGLDVQYGDLFKYKTPRELAAFLAGGEVESTEGSNFSRQVAGFDYAPIDALLGRTRTELFDGFRVHSLGDVLLTGATGYLGIHVLHYLLEKTSSSVTLLIRPKGKISPERRLDAQYVYYFGERMSRSFRDRISFAAGDITDADLCKTLAGVEVTTVINCAALVKHYIADDALDRVNVRGVENLIDWCAATHTRLVQVSTYSIGGLVEASAPALLDERHFYVGQDSDNDYIRTKFLAERAVLSAIAAGKVHAKIMRLGNLMGREADGEFQMNLGANAFVNSLKSYKAIGAYPLDELAAPMEMSPIDRVAEAICLLSTTPDDMIVFHPYNAYSLDMGAVLGALNRRGYAVDFTSRSEFAARVDALRADPTRADELQGILHYAQRHLDGRKPTPVANFWTTTTLYRLGFRWKPAEDSYLANFFDMLEGLAAFD